MIVTRLKSPEARRTTRLTTIVCCIAVMAFNLFGLRSPVFGELPKIRRVMVDADSPEQWLNENLQPIAVDDLEALVQKVRPETPSGPFHQIGKAVYTAIFDESAAALRNGEFVATIRSPNEGAVTVQLDPLQLPVSNLRWRNGEEKLVWGTVANHHILRLTANADSELVGDWTLQGRRINDDIEFSLSLAPATVSLIDLWLPPNRSLRSPEGSVTGPIDVNALGMRKWRVELGAHHQCLLVLTKADRSQFETPRVVYNQDSASLIRAFGGQFTTGVTLNVFRAPIQELTFTVSEAVNIQSVSYGSESGQSVPLSWKETAAESDDSRHLTVILPDPVLGPSRRIQIQTTFSPDSGGVDVLPKVVLNDAVFSTGDFQLQVESPLEIRSFNAFGMRQTEPLDVSPAIETLRFQQIHPDGHLAVDIGRPNLSLSAAVRTHLDTRARDWLLVSQVEWRNRSGSTFSVRCQIPREWRVTDVTAYEEAIGNEISNWWVERFDNRAEIVVEFKDALTPSQSAALQISARRKVADDTLSILVPVLQPLDCSEVNSLYAIAYPATDSPVWNDVQGIEQTDEATWSADPVSSPTDTSPSQVAFDDDSSNVLFLRSTVPTASAPLEFRGSRNTFVAEASVAIQITGTTVTERYELRGTPTINRLRQIFVYLTSAGPALDWQLQSGDVSSIAATKLSKARHAEWNLPEFGELWEVRFSASTNAPFELQAARTRTYTDSELQPLLFVPRADSFQGNVSLLSDIPHPQVTTELLTPTQSPRRDRLDNKSLPNRVSWTYDSPEGLLRITNLDASSPDSPTTSATASVRVIFNSDRHWRDFYQVRYYFAEPNTVNDFEFRLGRQASLISVRVDGVPLIASENDQNYVVPIAGPSPPESVEIEYSVSAATGFLQHTHPIITPDVSHSVLRTEWQFVLSPEWEIRTVSDEFYGLTSGRQISWRTRIFGPLGRRPTESIFNPLKWECWNSLLGLHQETDQSSDSGAPQDGGPFADWQTTHATTAEIPKSASIVLFNTTRSTTLSWMCLLGVFTAGLVLRIVSWRRRRFGVYSVAICAISAAFAPPAFAEILGGCFIGAIFAILCPLQILNRLGSWNAETQSTVAYAASSVTRASTIGSALFLSGLWTVSALAQQEFTNGITPNPSTNTNNQPDENVFDLYVPIDRNLRPVSNVVYASNDLIEKLNELRKDTIQPASYVIQSAIYEGEIHPTYSSVNMTARYEIVVLPGESTVAVPLSLAHANPFSCAVNGEPASIRRGTNGIYFIDLSAETSGPETRQFEVVVSIRPDIQFSAGTGAFQMEIPRVLDSQAVFSFPQGVAAIEFPGAKGEINANSTHASAALGPITNLQVTWHREPQQKSIAEADADVACVVEAFPTRLQYRYRVDLQVTDGSVDFLKWKLPKGTIVTNCSGSVVSQWSNRTGPDERTTLLINLMSPQNAAFSLDIELTHPKTIDSDDLDVPALLPFTDDDSETILKLRSYQVGVSPTPGYQIEFINPMSSAVENISIEEFLQNWQQVETLRPPRLAFDVESPLDSLRFRFTELSTVRTVQMSQLCELESNRIQWTLSANIAVSKGGAPAFRHTLDLDPRLTLESVSVEENDAERLLRWSRQGRRIDLYLKDKTSGIQNLTIVATLPTANNHEVKLPEVGFHNVDLVDSELRLIAPTAAIDAISYRQQRQPLAKDASRELSDGRFVFLDRFPLDVNLPPPVLHMADYGTDCESIVVVERISRDRARITQFWAFPAVTGNRTRVTLQLPEQIAKETKFIDNRSILSSATDDDGNTVFEIALNAANSEHEIIEFTTLVPLPTSGEWDVPIATCLSHIPARSQLVIRPQNALLPQSPEIAPETITTPPAWFTAVSEEHPTSTEADIYNVTQATASGTAVAFLVASFVDESIATLADTCVWFSPNGVDLGSTTFVLVTPPDEPIHISIPEPQQVKNVIVNGIQVPFEINDESIIAVSPQTDSPIQAVCIHWTFVGDPRNTTVSQFHYPLPTLVDITVHKSMITILPPEDFIIAFGNREMNVTANESRLDLLEGLLNANQLAFESSRQIPTFGWELLKSYQSSVQNAFGEPSFVGPTEHDQLRLENLSDEIGQLQELTGESVFLSEDDHVSQFAFPILSSRLSSLENGVLVRLENDSGQPLPAQLFALNSAILKAVLFTFSLFAAIVGFRYISRVDLSDWITSHPLFAALLMCTIWWSFFRFSVFGLFGMAIIACWIARRLSKPRTSEVAGVNS